MEREFIPYEQALELKELGFDIPSISGYSYPDSDKLLTQAILYQQAFRWFREKHGVSVSISINWEEGIGKDSSYGKYACSLEHKSYDESIGEFIGVFKRYEEAELECLKGLIEITKKK